MSQHHSIHNPQSLDPRQQGPAPEYPQKPIAQPGSDAEMTPQADHGETSYRGLGRLDGRVALITGGDSGIGRAVAIAFAREGADVAISYLAEEEADAAETRQWVEDAGRRAVTLPGDIQDESHCQRLVETVLSKRGRLDVLVNPNLLPYAATKGAIVNFTKGLSQLAMKQGVRVNAVAPGPVWTPLIPSTMPEDKVKQFGADTSFGRAAQPVELAPLFVFLASNEARFVTGEVYGATGGRSPY